MDVHCYNTSKKNSNSKLSNEIKPSPIRAMELELSVMPIEYYVQKQIWTQYLKLSTYRKFRMPILYGERSMLIQIAAK